MAALRVCELGHGCVVFDKIFQSHVICDWHSKFTGDTRTVHRFYTFKILWLSLSHNNKNMLFSYCYWFLILSRASSHRKYTASYTDCNHIGLVVRSFRSLVYFVVTWNYWSSESQHATCVINMTHVGCCDSLDQ